MNSRFSTTQVSIAYDLSTYSCRIISFEKGVLCYMGYKGNKVVSDFVQRGLCVWICRLVLYSSVKSVHMFGKVYICLEYDTK